MPAMIDRRELMAALGSAAVAWPVTAWAQQQPMPMIGYVTGSMKLSEYMLTTIRKELADFGYVEGPKLSLRDSRYQLST
jgi:putative ABC transport system substrate-binding protein